MQVSKGRRARTGMVYGRRKKPPNCGNSLAASCVSENTADTMLSLTERPPKRKKKLEEELFERIRIQILR